MHAMLTTARSPDTETIGFSHVSTDISRKDTPNYFNRHELFEKSDFHTLGGLILQHLQHVPQSGETLEWNGFKFEVVDMDGARIDKVLVTAPIAEDNGDEDA